MRHLIEVWVCPTPECPNYYGAASIEGEDLKRKMNRDIKSSPTFSRAICQRCKAKGIEVERVCYYAIVLGFGPERGIAPELAVEAAFKQLREAGHASVS